MDDSTLRADILVTESSSTLRINENDGIYHAGAIWCSRKAAHPCALQKSPKEAPFHCGIGEYLTHIRCAYLHPRVMRGHQPVVGKLLQT
jgi:hypothetical protein